MLRADPGAPRSEPPRSPPRRRPSLGSCLVWIVVGVVAAGALGLFALNQLFRLPEIPETGVLDSSARQEVRLEAGQDVSVTDVVVRVEEAEPDKGEYRTGYAPGWARPTLSARFESTAGSVPALLAVTRRVTDQPARLVPVDADGSVTSRGECLDAEACELRYRILAERPPGADGPLVGTLVIDGHLEYPTNVPAPRGAELALELVAAAVPVAGRGTAETTRETVVLGDGALPVARTVTVDVPAADANGAADELPMRVRLFADVMTDNPSRPRPTSDSVGVLGAPARATLIGLTVDPVVVDLGRGHAELLVTAPRPCRDESPCSVELVVVLERTDPTPDSASRVDWSLHVATAGSRPVRLTVAPLDATPILSASTSGEAILTRREPSATQAITLRLLPAPARVAPQAAGLSVPITATLTLEGAVSGSTRKAPVDVSIDGSDLLGSRTVAALVRVHASEPPEAAVLRPFDGCSATAECTDRWTIALALPADLVQVLSSDEVVTVTWRLEVVMARFGPPPAPDEVLPTLVVE